MTEYWKQWEGQVIADAFPLQQYLGGDGDHAVFLTEYSQPAPHKAAIKIVLGDPESTKVHLRRWSLAAKLSHRHLVQIYTTGRWQLGDTPAIYLVMEYADQSLADVIPVRPLTADEARETLEPALSALSYLHAQGFVHGHLKPGKIMAAGDCLKIASSEVCQADECPPAVPDGYSPPEQTMSPAGDVWSLGVVLVEALTQHLPLLDPERTGDPEVPETLPPPFLAIARQCLRFDPTARPTVADIAAQLRPPVKLTRLKWSYALAAIAGLILAAVVIAPRLIDRQDSAASPVEPTQIPPQIREAPPVRTAPKVGVPAPVPPSRNEPGRNEIVQRVLPKVPSAASRTIRGSVKVSVRVRVDPSGKVVDARIDSSGPSRYFAQLALQAARQWKFAPVEADRLREWILHFEFSRTGTRVAPIRKT